jgi:hypothetical protein
MADNDKSNVIPFSVNGVNCAERIELRRPLK